MVDKSKGKVSNKSVSRDFMNQVKRHPYLNSIKATSAECQSKLAPISHANVALEVLAEELDKGQGIEGHVFEHCKLNYEKFLVGNQYDSGECAWFECNRSIFLLCI